MVDIKKKSTELSNNTELKNSEISGSVNPERTDKSRRTALFGAIGVAGAASLPSEWKKPVIDGLVLPAHAQMSPSVITQVSTTTVQQPQIGSYSGIANCHKYVSEVGGVVSTALTNAESGGEYAITFAYTQYTVTICEDGMGRTTIIASSSDSSSTSTSYFETSVSTNLTTTSYTNFGDTTYITYSSTSSYTTSVSVTTEVTVTV
jgi:hypothetical protein